MTRTYYSHRPVLAAEDVQLMHRLNRDYLDLLTGPERRGDSEAGPLLAPALLQELAGADDTRRNAIAACSYALFALGFPQAIPDQGMARVEDPVAERYRHGDETGAWAAFITTVWFFAWHLSRSSPLSARFILGLTLEEAAVLAGFVPWQLRHLVMLRTAPLAPRWRTNPCFWPDLVRFAGGGQSLRLTAAHLLGVQLLAAEAAPRTGRPAGHARLRGP